MRLLPRNPPIFNVCDTFDIGNVANLLQGEILLYTGFYCNKRYIATSINGMAVFQ